MKRFVHPVAGVAALGMIAVFWLATAGSELSGRETLIVQVKTLIPWGFLVLLPALAAAGGTGFALAGPRQGGVVDRKRRRMPIIAANGLLILVPSALFLAAKAQAGELDVVFYSVQAIELVAGAANIWLLGQNVRDGFRLTRAWRR